MSIIDQIVLKHYFSLVPLETIMDNIAVRYIKANSI